MTSSALNYRPVRKRAAAVAAAERRLTEVRMLELQPDAATVSELAQLQLGAGVADALRNLKQAQRGLAAAMRPSMVAAVYVADARLRSTQQQWALLEAKQARHAALISAVRNVAPVVPVKLASDHLSAVCAASSERKRKRTHSTTDCTRRAACVGTSAPAAPPAAVGNRQATAQLCADQSGVVLPM